MDIPTPLPEFVWGDPASGSEITFDAATARVAIFSYGTLIEYDAAAEEWIVLTQSETSQDGGAFDPLAGEGMVLIEARVFR